MNSLFETVRFSTTRKATGSKISFSLAPEELSGYNLLYENPIHKLSIGIIAIYISETFAIKNRNGHVIEQPVRTGLILEKGRLEASLVPKLSSSAPPSAINDVINDLYELIIELLNSNIRYHLNRADIRAHIYEAEPNQFYAAKCAIPDNVRPGLEMILKLQAILLV